jgi:hypothetical protein
MWRILQESGSNEPDNKKHRYYRRLQRYRTGNRPSAREKGVAGIRGGAPSSCAHGGIAREQHPPAGILAAVGVPRQGVGPPDNQ